MVCNVGETVHTMAENLAPEKVSVSSDEASAASTEPQPSYVKLAMRNMVRKGGKSLFHFSLTVVTLIGLFVGLSYLTR